jgi:hypothetical protein
VTGEDHVWTQAKEEDNASYTGQLLNGVKNGFGAIYWKDGSLYEGMWVDDKAEGLGRF